MSDYVKMPIKIAFIASSYGNHTAFVCDDVDSLSTGVNRNDAIVDALIAAGKIELVDIDERRREKIFNRMKPAAPLAVAPPPEPSPTYEIGSGGPV